ncbi:hypothetical protein [Romboutsia sp.]|uniref:hypothetical protein n=1 Tax=Romboutsia sp. TaxID=1965302 RepID=UPI002B5A487A|nr:hypothetical protein [Romboutsia sp.]HSQ87961.1 hypothetical protein [Romboutsia sp.]
MAWILLYINTDINIKSSISKSTVLAIASVWSGGHFGGIFVFVNQGIKSFRRTKEFKTYNYRSWSLEVYRLWENVL